MSRSDSEESKTRVSEYEIRLHVLPVSGTEWNDLGESSRVLATIEKRNLQPGWMTGRRV